MAECHSAKRAGKEINNYDDQFDSPTDLNFDFDINYYEKRSSECWIEDPDQTLWCDGDSDSGQLKKNIKGQR